MKKVAFITGSEGKVAEAQAILEGEIKVVQKNIDLEEIQAIDGKTVAKNKVKKAYKLLKHPVLVEDTSLYFDAWNRLPGALIKWFLKTAGNEGMCKMMLSEKNRKAWAEVTIGYYDGKKTIIFTGRLEGHISNKPKGVFGFGWDPIFIPKGYNKTFGEMSREDKNKISMRKIAFDKLQTHLTSNK